MINYAEYNLKLGGYINCKIEKELTDRIMSKLNELLKSEVPEVTYIELEFKRAESWSR